MALVTLEILEQVEILQDQAIQAEQSQVTLELEEILAQEMVVLQVDQVIVELEEILVQEMLVVKLEQGVTTTHLLEDYDKLDH